jgi:hypothetical protein
VSQLIYRIVCAAMVTVGVVMLIVATADAQTAKPSQFSPRDEDPKEYAAGPGRDDTFYACTACHAFKIVAQQGMTREQWDESLNWMTQRHKMPPITGRDRDVILAYLAASYGPKPDTGARGWKNPFAPQ